MNPVRRRKNRFQFFESLDEIQQDPKRHESIRSCLALFHQRSFALLLADNGRYNFLKVKFLKINLEVYFTFSMGFEQFPAFVFKDHFA
jgi:hypothetical protein